MGTAVRMSVEDLDRHLWSIPPIVLRSIDLSVGTTPKSLMESVRQDISDRYPDFSGAGFLKNTEALSTLVSLNCAIVTYQVH